ncbi:MAG: DUF456 domain-containing protein [Kiritimatiellae bacterium]|nr:DUF456 domain-containing protein [Kiritimatiellia bacterium]MBQ6327749.1 DUF456 domain-containing protein [Kiritimatiellia bacterium]
MSAALLSVAIVLMIAGLIGCVVPIVPGPVLAYCGLLCMIPTSKAPSSLVIAVFGAAALVVTVLDYVVPALGAKRFKCSKYGTWGCAIGTFVGIFFFPLGILLGPFCGAVVGELLARKSAGEALWGGFGAFLGFLSGVLMKIVFCAATIFFYFRSFLVTIGG